MVQNWLPEPPNDSPVDDLKAASGEIMMMDTSDTDDEMYDQLSSNDGYEPLPLGPSAEHEQSGGSDGDSETECDSVAPRDLLPAIVPMEDTLLQQVWSAPVPSCIDIQMDSTKANAVKQAMANFTLPPSSIPEWAANIPEDQWKEKLITRIQNMRQHSDHK